MKYLAAKKLKGVMFWVRFIHICLNYGENNNSFLLKGFRLRRLFGDVLQRCKCLSFASFSTLGYDRIVSKGAYPLIKYVKAVLSSSSTTATHPSPVTLISNSLKQKVFLPLVLIGILTWVFTCENRLLTF